jgi:hypothetical protein
MTYEQFVQLLSNNGIEVGWFWATFVPTVVTLLAGIWQQGKWLVGAAKSVHRTCRQWFERQLAESRARQAREAMIDLLMELSEEDRKAYAGASGKATGTFERVKPCTCGKEECERCNPSVTRPNPSPCTCGKAQCERCNPIPEGKHRCDSNGNRGLCSICGMSPPGVTRPNPIKCSCGTGNCTRCRAERGERCDGAKQDMKDK